MAGNHRGAERFQDLPHFTGLVQEVGVRPQPEGQPFELEPLGIHGGLESFGFIIPGGIGPGIKPI